ncbi:ubiquitin-conjugating enzyme E2 6 [Elysia marginata]|uniref:Ubiquitin-conjugating enzyme E2 6 n=1 Tax=Elysia marginata TaxID=1093978 RepID=A0AAV4GBE4_9GAST|nr:ubiquitin-conjugating enzyme E2 6 [Elysia marginata]
MANANQKQAIKRLMFDQEELRLEPVANVSAAPLDEDMFEWHCNIKQDDIIFHLILFFPKDYPYSSPSAEFVPVGFSYNSGATMPGKKGTKICLNIFSDFANIHTEWKNTKGAGWSPGYTVQTVLMNVVAFLAETQSSSGNSGTYNNNLKMSKSFCCKDCGHTYSKPYPELETIQDGKGKGKASKDSKNKTPASAKKESESDKTPQIIDYISKEKFKAQKPDSVNELFGYGLVVSGNFWRPTLTSPCEFLTGRSFYGMKKAVNIVHSVLKEELKLFLPLFIHPDHGSQIKDEFEKTLREVAKIMPKYDPKTSFIEELVLKTIPNLMKMIKEFKAENADRGEGPGESEAKSKPKVKNCDKAETQVKDKTEGKGSASARGASRGRGKTAGKGTKRKAEDDDDQEEVPKSKKAAAAGRGRGRGRGSAAKKQR